MTTVIGRAGRTALSFCRRAPAIEALPVMLLVVLAAGLWVFAEVAEDVTDGDIRAFDEAIILSMRQPGDTAAPIGPAWLPETARDITAFGSTSGLIFISVMVIGWLIMSRRPHAAALLAFALIGGTVLANALKAFFERPRPDLVAHGTEVFTLSFPSSHAMMSTTVYLTLGVLVMRFSPSLSLKIYALGVALLLAVLIGVSRVYLGVHWPTDVIAGWAVGAAWASLVWLAALWLQGRGEVEKPPATQADAA